MKVITKVEKDYKVACTPDEEVCVTIEKNGELTIGIASDGNSQHIFGLTKQNLEALAHCIAAALQESAQ